MKKPALPVTFWIIFHAGLALALILSLFFSRRPLSVNTNLADMLPPSSSIDDMTEAERLFNQKHNRDFVILSRHADFALARENAEQLYLKLQGFDDLFEELLFFIDERIIFEYSAFLHEYRYALLDPQSAGLLETGDAQIVADEALARAGGASSFTGHDYLDTDPFLLVERELRFFLGSSLFANGLALRDDVLTAQADGVHYVVIRGRLSEKGASTDSGSGVREIFRAAGETPDKGGRQRQFVFSGFPFHRYESSANARREISLVGTITTLFLLVLFLYVFRSPLPALAIIFAAVISIASGLCAAFLVFRDVHILALNLGAPLIGLGVTYSIHFFTHRNRGLNGHKIRAALYKGVSLSFASSFVCFLILLFVPFDILRQFAIFSAVGLLSSYLTVICFFPDSVPPIKWDAKVRNTGLDDKVWRRKTIPVHIKTSILVALGIVCLITIFAGRSALGVKNDIRSLYSVPPRLLEWEKAASSVLNYGTGTWFLVSGSNLQELLEREEYFIARLNEAGSGTFLGTSRFIPSLKTQEARYRSATNLLPLVNMQFEALRFSRSYSLAYREAYAELAGHYVLPSEVPPFIAQIVSNFLLGQGSGGQWYSAIMLMDPSNGGEKTALQPEEIKRFLSLADEYEWVAAVNKAEDASLELNRLTLTMFKLLGIAYGLIIAAMALYYRNFGKVLTVAAVPLFAGLALFAVHACLGLSFSVFSISGFILVVGLGLDYTFYLTEDSALPDAAQSQDLPQPRASSVNLAVILSYGTSAVSFGSLVVSSFAPVKLLALSVLPGLSAAFLWAMLVKGRQSR